MQLYGLGGFGGIVNADASQAYRQVSVGVAAPSASELAQAPHYLFSFVDCIPRLFNASMYRGQVDILLNDHSLWVGGCPLFVGGSLFYVKSLFFRLPSVDSSTTNFLVQRPEGISDWEYLRIVDPVRAEKIHPSDAYRVSRALDLYLSSGVLPSSCEPRFDPVAQESIVVWLEVPDDALRKTIRTRVVKMLDGGWVDEIVVLVGTRFEEFVRDGYALGYDDVYRWVVEGRQENAREKLIQTLELKTWDYVRRQRKFWRSFKRALAQHSHSVEVVECSPDKVFELFRKN